MLLTIGYGGGVRARGGGAIGSITALISPLVPE